MLDRYTSLQEQFSEVEHDNIFTSGCACQVSEKDELLYMMRDTAVEYERLSKLKRSFITAREKHKLAEGRQIVSEAMHRRKKPEPMSKNVLTV